MINSTSRSSDFLGRQTLFLVFRRHHRGILFNASANSGEDCGRVSTRRVGLGMLSAPERSKRAAGGKHGRDK